MAPTTSDAPAGSDIEIRLSPNNVWQKARHFETSIDERIIRFQDDHHQTISEHSFPRYTHDFPFWSRAGDGDRYLKCNVTSLLSLSVKSLKERLEKQRPTYSFRSKSAYKLFLEHLRALGEDAEDPSSQEVAFERDFICDKIKPHEQDGLRKHTVCHHACVKVWYHLNSAPTISIPLMEQTGNVVKIKELSASRFELYKPIWKERQVDILLSQAERRKTFTSFRIATSNTTASTPSSNDRRTQTGAGNDIGRHGPAFPMPDENPLPGMNKITLEFAGNDDRAEFLDALDVSKRATFTSQSRPNLTFRATPHTSPTAPRSNASHRASQSSNASSYHSPLNDRTGSSGRSTHPSPNYFNGDVRQAHGNGNQQVDAGRALPYNRAGTTWGVLPRPALATPPQHSDPPDSGAFVRFAGGEGFSQDPYRHDSAHPASVGLPSPWITGEPAYRGGPSSQDAANYDDLPPRGPLHTHSWPGDLSASVNQARYSSTQAGQSVERKQTVEQIELNWKRQSGFQPVQDDARRRANANVGFYQHAALPPQDCLRVLTIQQGQRDDPLNLHFAVEQLAVSKDTYDALSYNWGSGDVDERVMLNGDPTFLVSAHLAKGLRHIRLAREDRRVWIDAICINQLSLGEMNHQVSLMGEIYSHARRTIIWFHDLGAIRPCRNLLHAAHGDHPNRKTLCSNPSTADAHHLEAQVKQDIRSLLDRLKSEQSYNIWHFRLWCVQEFYFSRLQPTVYVGPHALDWNYFARLFSQVQGHETSLSLFSELYDMKRTGEAVTLHQLCTRTGALKVGNPRDRIFSLIHMSQGRSGLSKMETVYEKSVLQVHEDALLYMIKDTGSLDVMTDYRADRTKGPSFGPGVMPTYLPDLTQLVPLEEVRSDNKSGYYSGYSTGARVQLVSDSIVHPVLQRDEYLVAPRLLKIKARYFGEIARCTNIKDQDDLRHEKSPSGHLIYSSFKKPGKLVEHIIKTLDFFFESNMNDEKGNRSPQLGRLILEYLLEDKRYPITERRRCSAIQLGHLPSIMDTELTRDRTFASYMSPAAVEEEHDFIEEQWKARKSYIVGTSNNRGMKFDLAKMVGHKDNKRPWNQVIDTDNNLRRVGTELYEDMQAALEYENLFCFARKSRERYYMFDQACQKYYRPMRSDVLRSGGEYHFLQTQHAEPDEGIEWHPYSEKSREREFFKTRDGFIGLGPAVAQPGDQIVVAHGASRPLILRPCAHMTDGSYTLVGEAILPAIMHGEWLANELGEDSWYSLR